MELFKITAKIPRPVEEVFEYITTPSNFPRWKKDVWTAGVKYGEMGLGCRMIQTVYLMSPRQFMMHVTGFEKNRYFKFEALKGFCVLPGWSFTFEACEESTVLTVVSSVNVTRGSPGCLLYPQGLWLHWKAFLKLLGKELCGSGTTVDKMEMVEEIPVKEHEEVTV
jgi:hypothetical protein